MRSACLLAAVLWTSTTLAQVGSTADEWAARFAPEAGPKPGVPDYALDDEKAAADLAAGRFRAALSDISGDRPAGTDAERRLLRARALIGLGETTDALTLLADWPTPVDNAKDLVLARLYLDLGDFNKALAAVQPVLERAPDFYEPRVLRGQALEAAGRFKEAIDAYRWFLDPPQDLLHKWESASDSFDDAAALTNVATAVERWATLTTAYKDDPKLNDAVLAMYTRAFDVIDRTYTPARIAAGQFCLARGDGEKAAALLGPLDKSVPRSRELLAVLAEQAVASGSESAMHVAAGRLRDADPDSPEATLMDIYALARARAAGTAERAAALHQAYPARPDVAGVDAAMAYLSGDEPRMWTILKSADAAWPARSDVYATAAAVLAGAFQRDPAAALLRTAIARTPWETAPRHLLGDLYLNDGYDDKARETLEAARALDPYNVKTLNYLNLLDELARYDKRLTEHLIVYSDKDADPIAAEQIGDYLESTYVDLCSIFSYMPKTKIVVQIYSEDDAFSVRMAGVPGVENFGVSFGRVLATIAPRKGTRQGNFNWARVLRHELVHTINLLATDNRCPRWLTEGLAVWQEHVPFRFDGVAEELYKRTMADELFTVRGFPLAFLRPKKPGDGEQAYTQGAYLAMYLDEHFGRASIVKLLDGYAAGKTDEQAFHAATGEATDAVEAGWHDWMKKKVAPWGYDDATAEKAKALDKEGDVFIKTRRWPDALRAYESLVALQPMAVRPHQRLAGLYLQKDSADPARAIEHLKFLHVLELQDNRYAKQISRLYLKSDDLPNAIEWARQATYVDLYDPAAHDLLADLSARAGDADAAGRERQAANAVRVWQEKRRADADK